MESFVEDMRACIRLYTERMAAAEAKLDWEAVERIGAAYVEFRRLSPVIATLNP